jgi:hypothetical protein
VKVKPNWPKIQDKWIDIINIRRIKKGLKMPLIIRDEKKEFEQCPSGTHMAVCAYVFDIGNQEARFSDQEVKVQHKAVISFELSKKMSDGRPFMLSKFYTLSFAEKSNLTRDLMSWRGRGLSDEEREEGFDLETLIGENCLLGVAQNDKGKSIITTISALPEGMPKIQIQNPVPSEKYMAWIKTLRDKSVTIGGDDSDIPI